jgi:tRNA pseudouridine55 synthase
MNIIEGEVFYLNKPLHWTSFQLTNKVKRAILKELNIKKLKVGHAGTLDPLATGVMIICTGKLTKQIENYQAQTKEYIAKLELGATTPSFDLEHPIDNRYETCHITQELVEKILPKFIGEIKQTPPIYSAVKIEGKRAYDYAREGKEITLKEKILVIDSIEILHFSLPVLTLRIVCSKGTYIRALARDIGLALGSGAHLTALERTRIGEITIDKCMSIDNFIENISLQNKEKV